MSKKILVVAAHPDDEVLGCGATIARHAKRGDSVWVLILGQGIASRRGQTASKAKRLIADLRECSNEANQLLGVKKLIHKDFPDNAFDSVSRLQIIQAVEEVVEACEPELVYTHSSSDLNVDHQITCEAVKTACRPLPKTCVKGVFNFEVASSTEWSFRPGNTFHPAFFTDVSEFIGKKLEAMKQYKDELREFPHARSLDFLSALSKFRGGQCGVHAAEAFEVTRLIQN